MSNCIGLDDCAQELDKLLSDIRAKLEANDDDQTVIVAGDQLVDFTRRSEPSDFGNAVEVEQIRKLDAHANETRRDLMASAIGKRVLVIMNKTAELSELVKRLKAESAQNEGKAKRIRLIPIVNTVDALTALIEELKKAKQDLKNEPDETTIGQRIDRLQKAFSDLEASIKEFRL